MVHAVEAGFERALEDILVRVFACCERKAPPAIAVAYSGGLDSAVLLQLAASWARNRNAALHAFHVHHGLSANADHWLAHCQAECQRLGVAFVAERVQVKSGGSGIEQAARMARYAALGRLCAHHDTSLLLTAHHLDDQAETVLLQLLRGSGVAGLRGMERANAAPALLGAPAVRIARPLLDMTRASLQAYAESKTLRWVEDESNLDIRYTRNRLRHAVVPALARHFPGFERRVARAAVHAAAAQSLLDELAVEDLRGGACGDGLDVGFLAGLSEARCNNLLRHWFAVRKIRMPSASWLTQMREQLFAAGEDARVRITHPDCEVWRYRGRVMIAPRVDDESSSREPVRFVWQGQETMPFPGYGGKLVFEAGGAGMAPDWLRGRELTLRRRQGGERLKPASNRSTRDLKHHFQALGIPPWERCRLPLVLAGDALLYASGIGMNAAAPAWVEAGGIVLRWQAVIA